MQRWFTLAEVAALFDVSVSTVKRWADSEKLATETMPCGRLRRATAASIRLFARQYGAASLVAFGGILAVGRFALPAPDHAAVVGSMFEAGQRLQSQFPAVVLVSFADGEPGTPAEVRAGGFDGMLACVVNDDDLVPREAYQRAGWQMVCRHSEDYWQAATQLSKQATAWWKLPKGEVAHA